MSGKDVNQQLSDTLLRPERGRWLDVTLEKLGQRKSGSSFAYKATVRHQGDSSMQSNIENNPLWQRLQDLDLDKAGVSLPFSRRLARENGWSEKFSRRVIEEYKRFVFLTACQSNPVTPSDEIDQAWHLHLQYSQHYWKELCDGVLGTKLHHGPTSGGPVESDKYQAWYQRTLDLYEETFGEPPARDIWPPVDVRFAYVDDFRRVNTATHFVIPKVKSRIAGISATALALVGCAKILEDKSDVAAIFFLVALIYVVWKSIKKAVKNKGKDNDSWFGGGCAGCGGCGGCS
ncbi:MAG: hypothetical protein AAF351_14030 [Pseudomonadota bacterium]